MNYSERAAASSSFYHPSTHFCLKVIIFTTFFASLSSSPPVVISRSDSSTEKANSCLNIGSSFKKGKRWKGILRMMLKHSSFFLFLSHTFLSDWLVVDIYVYILNLHTHTGWAGILLCSVAPRNFKLFLVFRWLVFSSWKKSLCLELTWSLMSQIKLSLLASAQISTKLLPVWSFFTEK